MTTIGILVSGRGSNMEALLDAVESGAIDARVGVVVSNVPGARGLVRARERGIPAVALDHRGHTREEHDRRVREALEAHGVELVCLAGYMRLLSSWFIASYPNRILNIHPSLLPAFPGLGAQRQALEYGVKVSGCTVHYVDEELDHGPILLQRVVPVHPGDSEDALSARILVQEHLAYPEAVALVTSGKIRVEGRVVVRVDVGGAS